MTSDNVIDVEENKGCLEDGNLTKEATLAQIRETINIQI